MRTHRSISWAAVLIFMTAMYAQAQTVRIANNNLGAPTGPNVYATLQAAIDAAAADDIIHIIPSPYSYGDATMGKRLKIYGVGHHPEKDMPLTSIVNDLWLAIPGSGPSGDASGSIISGIVANRIFFAENAVSTTYRKITIEKCNVNQIVGHNYFNMTNQTFDSLVINMCYISTIHFSAYEFLCFRNSVIKNNIISNSYINLGAPNNSSNYNIISNNIFILATVSAYGNSIISNNVFLCPIQSNYYAFGNLENCIVANNIFYSMMPRGQDAGHFVNNVFNNNISYNTLEDTLPPTYGSGNTGTNNLVGTDPLFVNYPAGGIS